MSDEPILGRAHERVSERKRAVIGDDLNDEALWIQRRAWRMILLGTPVKSDELMSAAAVTSDGMIDELAAMDGPVDARSALAAAWMEGVLIGMAVRDIEREDERRREVGEGS